MRARDVQMSKATTPRLDANGYRAYMSLAMSTLSATIGEKSRVTMKIFLACSLVSPKRGWQFYRGSIIHTIISIIHTIMHCQLSTQRSVCPRPHLLPMADLRLAPCSPQGQVAVAQLRSRSWLMLALPPRTS